MVPEHRGDPNEPPEIREMTKKALHEQLSQRFFLPPNNSRGVTRPYLVGVYRNDFYRLDLFQMQHFLADLTKEHMRKAPYINSNDIKAKVEVLLRENNMPPLGFPNGVIPEESWLLQIARVLDQSNSTAIFVKAVPQPEVQDTTTYRIHQAKRNAEHFELRRTNFLADPKFFHEIEAVWNSHKRLTNKRREVLVLQAALHEATQKQDQEGNTLAGCLSEASNMMYLKQNRGADPMVALGEGPQAQNVRNRLKELYQMYAVCDADSSSSTWTTVLSSETR